MVSALLMNTGYRKLWSQFMIWRIIEHKHGFHSRILYLPLNHSQNFNYFLYMSNSSNRTEEWPKKDPNSPGISHLWLISLLALTISSHCMAHTRFLFGSMLNLPCYFYPSDTTPELHFLNHVSGLPCGSDGRLRLQCGRPMFDFWVRKIPWEGNGYLLKYSCLENSMDRGCWEATSMGSQSRTWWSSSHFHTFNPVLGLLHWLFIVWHYFSFQVPL